MNGRKWLPWIALGVVLVVVVVFVFVRSRPDSSPTARAARLSRELACPVCNGQSVAESNAPESRQIRADIPRRIYAGESDGEIRAYYVSRYGARILLTPSNGGIGLVAWIVPVAVLLFGLILIALTLRRWSRTPRLAATPEDEAIVAAAREPHDA